MYQRNLRHLLLAGAARLIMSAADGDEDPPAGGGAAPAPEPAAEGGDGGEGGEAGGESQAAPAGDDPPAGEAGADAGGEPEPEAKKARVPWQAKRIDQLTARAATAEETAAAALAREAEANRRLEAYEALYGKDGTPPAPAAEPAAPSGVDGAGRKVFTEEDVQKEAARIAALQDLNRRCEGLFAEGTTKHGEDFQKRVNAAGQAFGADLRQRTDFFEALTALPNGADVYHQLTGDLDHFAEVLAMNPVQLGMELATISAKAGTKKAPPVSKVPQPIDPVAGNAGEGDDLTDMSSYAKDFERRREERAKARGY